MKRLKTYKCVRSRMWWIWFRWLKQGARLREMQLLIGILTRCNLSLEALWRYKMKRARSSLDRWVRLSKLRILTRHSSYTRSHRTALFRSVAVRLCLKVTSPSNACQWITRSRTRMWPMSISHARRVTQTGSAKPAAKDATTTRDMSPFLTSRSIDLHTPAATAWRKASVK